MKSPEASSSTSPRRRYDASGRQATALERQRRVLRAATELFLDQGYGRTSIAEIAAAAGVSAQSIYATFESKAGILEQAAGLARTGDERGSVSRSEEGRQVMAVPDLLERCRQTARLLRDQYDRSAKLLAIVEGAAATDPALADLHARYREQRRRAVTAFNAVLPDDALRPGLTRAEADDAMVFLSAAHTYHELVDEMGWSPDRYETWLAEALYRLFFDPA